MACVDVAGLYTEKVDTNLSFCVIPRQLDGHRHF